MRISLQEEGSLGSLLILHVTMIVEWITHSGMPWFCKTLPVHTTDYIKVHIVVIMS